MKNLIACCIVLLLLAGCEKPKLTESALIEQKPNLVGVEAMLNQVSKDHYLRWHIYCIHSTHSFDGANFQASAEDAETPPYARYIEDGAKNWWAARGVTQEEAGYKLYQSILQNPIGTIKAEHAPKDIICPPEISGGENQP